MRVESHVRYLQLMLVLVWPPYYTCAPAWRNLLGRICLRSQLPLDMCYGRLSCHQPCKAACNLNPVVTVIPTQDGCVWRQYCGTLDCLKLHKRNRTHRCCRQRCILSGYPCLRKLIKICSKNAVERTSLHKRVQQRHALRGEEDRIFSIMRPCQITHYTVFGNPGGSSLLKPFRRRQFTGAGLQSTTYRAAEFHLHRQPSPANDARLACHGTPRDPLPGTAVSTHQ